MPLPLHRCAVFIPRAPALAARPTSALLCAKFSPLAASAPLRAPAQNFPRRARTSLRLPARHLIIVFTPSAPTAISFLAPHIGSTPLPAPLRCFHPPRPCTRRISPTSAPRPNRAPPLRQTSDNRFHSLRANGDKLSRRPASAQHPPACCCASIVPSPLRAIPLAKPRPAPACPSRNVSAPPHSPPPSLPTRRAPRRPLPLHAQRQIRTNELQFPRKNCKIAVKSKKTHCETRQFVYNKESRKTHSKTRHSAKEARRHSLF